MIYLIKSGEYVKIGFSENINKRLSILQTGNPIKMEIIDYKEGNKIDEGILHSLCKEFRIRGEWFKDCDQVREIFKNYISKKLDNIKIQDKDFIYVNLNFEELYNLEMPEFRVLIQLFKLVNRFNPNEDILNNLQIKVNKMIRDAIKDKTGLAESTVKNAFTSLVKKGLLLKDGEYKSIYYLNPKFFFKGNISDRTKLVKHTIEYRISPEGDCNLE